MTLDNLWQAYLGRKICGYGQYSIQFKVRGNFIQCHTNNTLAFDRLHMIGEVTPRVNLYGYTERQALEALYNECKRKNNIR